VIGLLLPSSFRFPLFLSTTIFRELIARCLFETVHWIRVLFPLCTSFPLFSSFSGFFFLFFDSRWFCRLPSVLLLCGLPVFSRQNVIAAELQVTFRFKLFLTPVKHILKSLPLLLFHPVSPRFFASHSSQWSNLDGRHGAAGHAFCVFSSGYFFFFFLPTSEFLHRRLVRCFWKVGRPMFAVLQMVPIILHFFVKFHSAPPPPLRLDRRCAPIHFLLPCPALSPRSIRSRMVLLPHLFCMPHCPFF